MTSTQPDAPVETVSTKRLEEEGEIAADYLEELLDIADLDGDIDIDIDHGRAAVEIVSEDPADRSLMRLAGPDGEVLDALQELTRLAVQAKTGERSRLMLDVAGYRAGRRAELVAVANEAIARVQESGRRRCSRRDEPVRAQGRARRRGRRGDVERLRWRRAQPACGDPPRVTGACRAHSTKGRARRARPFLRLTGAATSMHAVACST